MVAVVVIVVVEDVVLGVVVAVIKWIRNLCGCFRHSELKADRCISPVASGVISTIIRSVP